MKIRRKGRKEAPGGVGRKEEGWMMMMITMVPLFFLINKFVDSFEPINKNLFLGSNKPKKRYRGCWKKFFGIHGIFFFLF